MFPFRIVACDVLMLKRETLDLSVAELERLTGLPAGNILINCTHSRHAPSTRRLHGYDTDLEFTASVQRGIASSVGAWLRSSPGLHLLSLWRP